MASPRNTYKLRRFLQKTIWNIFPIVVEAPQAKGRVLEVLLILKEEALAVKSDPNNLHKIWKISKISSNHSPKTKDQIGERGENQKINSFWEQKKKKSEITKFVHHLFIVPFLFFISYHFCINGKDFTIIQE